MKRNEKKLQNVSKLICFRYESAKSPELASFLHLFLPTSWRGFVDTTDSSWQWPSSPIFAKARLVSCGIPQNEPGRSYAQLQHCFSRLAAGKPPL